LFKKLRRKEILFDGSIEVAKLLSMKIKGIFLRHNKYMKSEDYLCIIKESTTIVEIIGKTN
jgi:hypothetical protein